MEEIYLKELSINDGEEELEFIRSFPAKENGFQNPCKGEFLNDISSFKSWLNKMVDCSNGIDVPVDRVPQTIYWIMSEEKIVGIIKFRHSLNPILMENGGNIGYGILPQYRGKGIASKALGLLLVEAKKYDLEEVLITVDYDNIASRKVVENNGGILKKEEDGTCFYWIKIKDKQPKTV